MFKNNIIRGAVVMLCLVTMALTACGKGAAKEKGAQSALELKKPTRGTDPDTEMSADKLKYFPSNRYWTKNGTKLVVEGGFYNLSGAYDVLELDDPYIYLNDLDGNTVYIVKVNENYVGAIPHGGFVPYNFTISDIPGGADSYKATELIPILATAFTYADHYAVNCPYCGNAVPPEPVVREPAKCSFCNGDGHVICPDCEGTGETG